jgi:phosphate transport system ATP-binding protein
MTGLPKNKIEIRDLRVRFGAAEALKGVSLDVLSNEILAVIGPANSGKSSLLMAINRMTDRVPEARVAGSIRLDGEETASFRDVEELRRRIGMVYALPIPLPMGIRDNILFGPRLARRIRHPEADDLVEATLRAAYLWDEVKDRLGASAMKLSGGQQQRLCIARALAVEPEVILMDEPASALDPLATLRIEELMQSLKENYTIVIVTHNMQQAARASDYTAFFNMAENRAGYLVEYGPTKQIFTNPKNPRTEDYVTGRFG